MTERFAQLQAEFEAVKKAFHLAQNLSEVQIMVTAREGNLYVAARPTQAMDLQDLEYAFALVSGVREDIEGWLKRQGGVKISPRETVLEKLGDGLSIVAKSRFESNYDARSVITVLKNVGYKAILV